ncbi:MAG: tetratricopeptide repeat protein [Candidatus Omnitrophota bacterium]
MKKAFTLLILLLFSFNTYLCPKGYCFWIWSPKTQKWKNPKYSALATPYIQYSQALKLFEQEKYKDAYREFKKLLANYPDSKEAAEAQYYLARCMEKFDKPYESFLEYQKVVDSYPNSQRINEIIEREYNIGEYFLNREYKNWMGMSLYDFVDHPSIEIFRRIVQKAPYSEYAPRAQYKLGMILMQLGRYGESRDAFQKIIDNYSDSEWAAPAKYQLATATAKAFPGSDYDSTYLEEASERLDEFIKEHPEAQISAQAQDQLRQLRDREAKKLFDTALFYENQDCYPSAKLYYIKVIDNYSDSNYYQASLEKIDELDELIRGNITKKELREAEKQGADTVKRNQKLRLKKATILTHKELREKKIKDKKELREKKMKRKLELKEERVKLKEIKKNQKLKRKKAQKAKKLSARIEKIKKKEEAKQRKIEERENRRLGPKCSWWSRLWPF